MSFELLQSNTLYKKQVTSSTGRYDRGKWIKGVDTVEYIPFDGEYEPYNKSESSITLPEGVNSSEAIVIYTEEPLKTSNDLEGKATVPDIIYLKDPDSYENVSQFSIEAKDVWESNLGFSLLPQKYYYYLAIRKEKGTN